MLSVSVYNMEGKVIGELALDDAVFGVKPNPLVVQRVATAQRANAAITYASTKGRGEIRGGGRKPWKQKGTGSARHGSRRSPIWRGGGITFGPTAERNQSQKINQKERRLALRMILSDKVHEGWMVVVDNWSELSGKTAQIVALARAVLPTIDTPVLFASVTKKEFLHRATKNLQNSNVILADSLNVGDMLGARYLMVDKEAVEKITKHFKA